MAIASPAPSASSSRPPSAPSRFQPPCDIVPSDTASTTPARTTSGRRGRRRAWAMARRYRASVGIESPRRRMFVLPREERDVPSRGRFGGGVRARTVGGMNTLNAFTSVVASHGEHDGWWFPFAFLWLALLGVLIWCLVGRGRRYRYVSGHERAS